MKTRLLAPLIGVALAAALPAGCERPGPTRAPVVLAPAPVTPPPRILRAPPPDAGPRPGEGAWSAWFATIAEVGRPCDEVMNALAEAPRARSPAAVRDLAQAAETTCFNASGGYGAVAPPSPLPPAGRRELERGISILSKGYLGRSLGLNDLARTAPESPEAAQTLGHAQDDIVAARAGLVAVARRYGDERIDEARAFAPALAETPREPIAHATEARLASLRGRPHARASVHRAWTGRLAARDRRWSPPPYPRYVAEAAPCDLGAPLSPHNCAHAYRHSEEAYAAQDRQEDARPRPACRRFWVLPCRLFGRGG